MFGDLTGGMFSSINEDEVDFTGDCEQRMAKGSPNEDLSNFQAVTRHALERTDIFLTADYRLNGERHVDNFHCVYNGAILTSDDRAPASQTAKQ